MLPTDIIEWLERSPLQSRSSQRNHDEQESIRRQLLALGISSTDEIYDFYLRFHSYNVRGWYELNSTDQIARATDYARRELSVSTDFIALTGIEGGGITLYNTKTGQVFDVEFGQFEELAAGEHPPVANSFVEYLRWCKAKDEEKHA